MSHFKERKEKNCLNCNAVVYGRFCHICGQENIEPRDTFGHLAAHFISDIFHFDGKFFSSTKYLLFKPGFLTYEYVRGRRASYLNPIKMYVFVSAIFFLFFLAAYNPEHIFLHPENQRVTVADVQEELNDRKKVIERQFANSAIPATIRQSLKDSLIKTNAYIELLKKDSSKKNEIHASLNQGIALFIDDDLPVEQYDSIQNALPEDKKDSWLDRQFKRKMLSLKERYKGDEDSLQENLLEAFFHHFPQVLFVSLPLFALILQLLYVRRKKWLYADHVIYTVHLYCAVYIFIFLLLLVGKLDKVNHFHWLSYLNYLIWIYLLFYTYKALKNFYGQSRVKTFFKWFLLNTVAFLIMISLFTIYFILSALML